MPKHLTTGLMFVFVITSAAGCSLTNDIQVRSYKQDKKRLDQIVDGTVGNWENAPQAVAMQEKDTRKVYFVEFSKEPKTPPNLNYLDEDITIDEIERQPSQRAYKNTQDVNIDQRQKPRNNFAKTRKRQTVQKVRRPQLDVPTIDDVYVEEDSYETDIQFVDYKVKSKDTLQKISKKFYNSYSKWPRIYEANKGVLKSPDFVEPGMVLKIPMN